MTDWPVDALAVIVGGIVVLAADSLCLTGRYKGWARDSRGPLLVLAGLPGLGLILLVSGVARMLDLTEGVLGLIGLVGALTLVALVITTVRPGWWGPRWYRERVASRSRRLSLLKQPDAARDAAGRFTSEYSEAVFEALFDDEPLEHWPATLVHDLDRGTGHDGQLVLLPGKLVFMGDKPYLETPYGQTVPVDSPIRRKKGLTNSPVMDSVERIEITSVQIRSELEWRDHVDGPSKYFRPAKPFLWIEKRNRSVLGPVTLSHPEEAARRISQVLKRPLEDVR